MKNIAYIDGQNLHFSTKEAGWKVDHKKFRVYLKEKYGVEKAYYFFGYLMTEYQSLYTKLQESGFILIFKKYGPLHESEKKGNVDTAMVFTIMKDLLENGNTFDKILLVTGDGDFYEPVRYLIEKERIVKVLLPAKKDASSLYKSLTSKYYDFLDRYDIQKRIGRQNEKGS